MVATLKRACRRDGRERARERERRRAAQLLPGVPGGLAQAEAAVLLHSCAVVAAVVVRWSRLTLR